MEILVTGNIKWLEEEFFTVLAEQNKVIVCGKDAERIREKHISPYQFSIEQKEFEKLFFTYHFQYVIYFSQCMEKDAFQEIEYLHAIFELCQRRQGTKLIYIRNQEALSASYGETQQIIESACTQMCEQHVRQGSTLVDLRIPFLAAADKPEGMPADIMKALLYDQKISLPFAAEQTVDFLFESDLAALLNAMMEEDETGYLQYELYGGNQMQLGQVISELEKAMGISDADVTYGTLCMQPQKQTDQFRYHYGWYPKENVKNAFTDWYIKYQSQTQKQSRRKTLRNIKMDKKWKERLLYIVECVLLFALCEFLTYDTRDMQLLDFADFRLFFVTIVGMMYGLRFGVAASVAACVMYFASSGNQTNWQIQFYNIVNWLPVAVYMLVGSIAGYTRDRYQDKLANADKSQQVLETKYIYLNELYTKALENKESYSSQIMNYKNSYGRIYAAVRQLNSVHPSEIFYHAIAVLEDMMDTQSVAIYSLDGGRYARLNACSRDQMNRLTKSLCLDDMPQCASTLETGETWVNREHIEGAPMYAYGIMKNGSLVGIIALQEVAYEQMSMEYMNRFNIISGLISDSLIRATNYQEIAEKDRMLPGTRILRTEAFQEEVEAQRLLKENSRADFVLLRVVMQETDYGKISDALLHVTRKNDILGLGEDGKVYILLSQADRNNLEAIENRMKKNGVEVEIAEKY